jgi:hypothetical protein
MKTLLLLLLIALFSMSMACTKDDKSQNDINIKGKWEVIATWDPYPVNSDTRWIAVNSDSDYYHTLIFQENSLYNFNLINQPEISCDGEYIFNLNNDPVEYRLFLNLSDCEMGNFGWILFTESLVYIENNDLILFEGTFACEEGCGVKYRRISN